MRERARAHLVWYIIYGERKLLLCLIVGSYRERVDGWMECAEQGPEQKAESSAAQGML